MRERGRRSSASLVAVSDGIVGVPPIHPPTTLTAAERNVWLGIVSAKPADWFGPEHVPMLTDYVRAVCRGHVIDEQIKAFDPEWLASDDGLKRYETLIGMAAKISGERARQQDQSCPNESEIDHRGAKRFNDD